MTMCALRFTKHFVLLRSHVSYSQTVNRKKLQKQPNVIQAGFSKLFVETVRAMIRQTQETLTSKSH